MTNSNNREGVDKLPVDYLGFILYPKSKRYAPGGNDPGLFHTFKSKVGVYVNEGLYEIIESARQYGFEFVQLHGSESSSTCRILKRYRLKVIKVFNLDESFYFESLKDYKDTVDYFLFDTKTRVPGGSGKKFNWDILERYKGDVPFFLSGGIQPGDAQAIKNLHHPALYGVDLNSGFEDKPGIKNIEKLEKFINELRNNV